MAEQLRREDVLSRVRSCKGGFARRYGVTRLGIFGSVAKGENLPGSDVDIVVELEKPDLFYLVHIKQELEEVLHCPVDVVHYREKMNSFLKDRILQEAVYV